MSYKPVNNVYVTDISGNNITIISGDLLVRTQSGVMFTQLVPGSGKNPVYITNESGNLAMTVNPGQLGDGLTQATQNTLNVGASLYAFDGSTINRMRTTVSGSNASQSGTQFRLLTDTVMNGSFLRTGGFTIATSGSGGVQLTTSGGIAPHGIYIKNIANTAAATTVSGTIHIGSSGNPPWISGGYVLGPGQEVKLNVYRPETIRVYGGVSGVAVSWMTVDF